MCLKVRTFGVLKSNKSGKDVQPIVDEINAETLIKTNHKYKIKKLAKKIRIVGLKGCAHHGSRTWF